MTDIKRHLILSTILIVLMYAFEALILGNLNPMIWDIHMRKACIMIAILCLFIQNLMIKTLPYE